MLEILDLIMAFLTLYAVVLMRDELSLLSANKKKV